MNDDDLPSMFEELSNWSRWGAEDERGTLNFITDSSTTRAVQLIHSGRTISCGRPMRMRPSTIPLMPTMQVVHMMTVSGESMPSAGAGSAADWLGFGVHGFETTHIDSHAHMFWNRKMYNGRSAENVTADRGAIHGGVEPISAGVFSRGVLVDGPTMREKPWLEPGDVLEPDELDTWYRQNGLEPRAGDIVYIRAGRDDWEGAGVEIDLTQHAPGMSPNCLRWLRDAEVSILASDVFHDPRPSSFTRGPIHTIGLVAMGLWLIDNAALCALARECKKERRMEFFSAVVPLALRRATGSPVNPVVIF